uniref:Uncharacterized protein n=1 Tax=Promethearchaeum syntrophicum TaxID=2594042 RepID=A0A5B9DGJ2_9ARCH|nr:hypothetical protein [Candidatus Prometheoarchaeum syntrophicum]QEE17787.1 hypothetical protein DSAG12_03625 [Candidatus Prometheoarchaeum syntrophicum]
MSNIVNIEENNLDIKVDGNTLTIVIDLGHEMGRSKSGKSMIVASTRGNIPVPENDSIKMGINIYKSI